jgi:hypothetical protein
MNFEKLNLPMASNEVEWRVITKPRDGKITVAPYIDSRCVMKRFDEAFGPTNWKSDIAIYGDKLIATISIRSDQGDWVSKSDGVMISMSDGNDGIDPLKSAVSDGLKRAATQWGLARDLYDYPLIQVRTEDKYLPNWSKKLLAQLVTSVRSGENSRDYVLIEEKSKPVAAAAKKAVEDKPQENGKPELDGLKFAKMLAAVNAGNWKEVESAMPKYSINEQYEKSLRSLIDVRRSEAAMESAIK